MAESNNVLLYTVKFVADEKSVNESARTLQEALDDVAKSKKSTSEAKKSTDELKLSLDELTKAYIKSQKNLAQLSEQIGRYKQQLSELKQEEKENGELTESQAKIKEALQLSIKDTTADYEKLRKEVIANQVASEATNKSYNDVLANIAKVGNEIKALSDPLGKNGEQFLALVEEYRKLSAEAKILKDALDGTKISIEEQNNRISSVIDNTDTLTRTYITNASQISRLAETIADYEHKLRVLTDAQKDGVELTQAQIAVKEGLKLALRDTKDEYTQLTREVRVIQQATEAQGNSMNDLKAQMRALSIEIANVQDPLGKGATTVEELTKRYNEMNNTLKTVDASMGNFQRNVGNYESGLRGLANALAVVQGPLGPIAGRVNSLATTMRRLTEVNERNKKSWTELTTIQKAWAVLTLKQSIPTITASATATTAKTTAIRLANGAIRTLNVTLKVLRGALIATGIGAFVVAIGSLVSFLTRTERGAQQLRVRLAGLRAAVDVIRDRVVPLGEAIFNAFNDPQQAVKDLWEAIKTNIMNRLKGVIDAFGALGGAIRSAMRLDLDGLREAGSDFANAFAQSLTGVEDVIGKLSNGFKEVGAEMRANRAEAEELERRMNDVLVAERELGVERAKQNRDLQEARDMARDMNVSFEERLNALRLIRESEMKLMEVELANERERLDVMIAQNALSEDSEKDKQAIADQQAKIFEMEQKHLERSISLRRDETSVERQRDEFLLRSLRNQITERERASNLEIQRVESEMRQRGEFLELALMRQKQFEENLVDERRARETAYFQEYKNQNFSEAEARNMAELRAKEELESEKLAIDEKVRSTREQRDIATTRAIARFQRQVAQGQFDESIAQANLRNDKIAVAQIQQAQLEQEIAREREVRIADMAQSFIDQGIEDHKAMRMAQQAIDEEYEQRRLQGERNLAKATLDVNRKMTDAYIDLAKNAGNAIFGDNKAVAVATTVMDTIVGARRQFKDLPIQLAIPAAASITAAGIASVRQILAVKKDTKTITTTSSVAPTQQFELVDATNFNAMAVASETVSQVSQPELTVILEGEFDKEALAVKVREGNNALSSRGITIRTGS